MAVENSTVRDTNPNPNPIPLAMAIAMAVPQKTRLIDRFVATLFERFALELLTTTVAITEPPPYRPNRTANQSRCHSKCKWWPNCCSHRFANSVESSGGVSRLVWLTRLAHLHGSLLLRMTIEASAKLQQIAAGARVWKMENRKAKRSLG